MTGSSDNQDNGLKVMRTQVSKSDRGLAIYIPEVLAAQASLEEGIEVEIAVVGSRVVVAPTVKQYDLNELLAGVTPDNLHGEIDTGAPVGHELW